MADNVDNVMRGNHIVACQGNRVSSENHLPSLQTGDYTKTFGVCGPKQGSKRQKGCLWMACMGSDTETLLGGHATISSVTNGSGDIPSLLVIDVNKEV